MMNHRQGSWLPIQQPASVRVDWSFNKADYDKLKAGVEARSMEEKWDIFFDGEVVHFYRSWTGYQIYSFLLRQDGNMYAVDSFDVEQDDTRYRRDNDKEEAENLGRIMEYVVGVKLQ